MSGDIDRKDKSEARNIALTLLVLVVLFVAASVLIAPMASDFNANNFAEGVGLKDAAVISFFVTTLLMVVLALAAGDGLLGELQFMIGAFVSFFVVIWLLVAWIF